MLHFFFHLEPIVYCNTPSMISIQYMRAVQTRQGHTVHVKQNHDWMCHRVHMFILICTLIIVALSLLSEESVNRKLWEERTVSRDYNAFVDARSVVSFRKSRPQKVFNSNRLWVGRVKPDVQIRMKLPCIVHDEERWILDRQTPGDLNTCCDVRPQSLAILQHWVVVQGCVDLWTNFL